MIFGIDPKRFLSAGGAGDHASNTDPFSEEKRTGRIVEQLPRYGENRCIPGVDRQKVVRRGTSAEFEGPGVAMPGGHIHSERTEGGPSAVIRKTPHRPVPTMCDKIVASHTMDIAFDNRSCLFRGKRNAGK